MIKPGFYWVILEDSNYGPEVARLISGMFFTTRIDGCGEVITASNEPEYVTVLAGPLGPPAEAA